MSSRALRIASLFAPSLLAAYVTTRIDNEHLVHLAAPVLVMLWVLMLGVLMMRVEERRPARNEGPSPWACLDVLTAQGAAMLWLGAIALVASSVTQWASVSVIGVLGLGTVYVTTIWSALVAGGDAPWRHAKVTRAVLPAVAVEGDPLREELKLAGVRIPAGMRLFATGRAMRRAPVSRYVVTSDASGAEIELETALGPARRGEHRAPPLALWLGDVLGITRTPVVYRGEASFVGLPRPVPIDDVKPLLGAGGDDDLSRPAQQLPTEGSFRIREYVPGDDTRRIHWVRSLQQNQLVVRLPDEIPLSDPSVRLILDTELRGVDDLTCEAPLQLLDSLVRVWLGIADAIAKSGARVTLVTAIDGTPVERLAIPRSPEPRRLGARVTWQEAVPLDRLIERTGRQIVVSSRPHRLAAEVRWIVVPELAWTTYEADFPRATWASLAYPIGCAENRAGRRRRERRRIEAVWQDRNVFSQATCWVDWSSFPGDYVARPKGGRVTLAVIP
jgi:uncharacterized protein (DUF58 family)